MPEEGSSSVTTSSVKQNSSGGSGEKSLSDEMFAEYKKMMRERQKAAAVLSFKSIYICTYIIVLESDYSYCVS